MKILSTVTFLLLLGAAMNCSSCNKYEIIIQHNKDGKEKITDRSVRPFKAEYETFTELCAPPNDSGYVTICITAEGNATHLGNSTWEASQLINFGTLSGYGVGIIFTAANGDQISGGPYTLFFEPLEGEPGNAFWGTIYIDSGTGHFEGVEGELPYYGESRPDYHFAVFHDGWLAY